MGCLRVISPLRLSLLQISRFRSFLKVVYLQDFKCMLHNFESSSKRGIVKGKPRFFYYLSVTLFLSRNQIEVSITNMTSCHCSKDSGMIASSENFSQRCCLMLLISDHGRMMSQLAQSG